MSLATLGRRLGIYPPDTELPDMREFPSIAARDAFWAQIAPDDPREYDPRTSNATWIRDPLLRAVHKVIAHTVCGRGDSPGKVPTPDLLYLYHIVTATPINLAQRIAEFFITSAGRYASSHICGGEYVTVLAESLNVLTPEILPTLTISTTGIYVTISTLRSMGLIRDTDNGPRLVDRNGVIWDPLPADEQGDDEDDDDDDDDEAAPEQQGGMPPLVGQGMLQFGEAGQGHAGGPHHGGGGYAQPQGHDFYYGPNFPSSAELYGQFAGLRTTVDEMREEQTRQGEVLDTFRAESHSMYQWIFGAHQSHERQSHAYEPPLPQPPQFPFDHPGSRKSARRGGGGEGSSRGAGGMDQD